MMVYWIPRWWSAKRKLDSGSNPVCRSVVPNCWADAAKWSCGTNSHATPWCWCSTESKIPGDRIWSLGIGLKMRCDPERKSNR